MTNNSLFKYNRQQALKTWQPISNLHLPSEQIQYYNYKIQTNDNPELIKYPEDVIAQAVQDVVWDKRLKRHEIDDNFLKHLVLLHMNHLLCYIENKEFVLGDVRWNIATILNEMINNEVDEDYYLNTKDIYEDILGLCRGDADVYDLLDQAIKRENWRMVYYLIFSEDEKMVDRLSELDGEVISPS